MSFRGHHYHVSVPIYFKPWKYCFPRLLYEATVSYLYPVTVTSILFNIMYFPSKDLWSNQIRDIKISNIRYGVVANIVVSHTTAGGSIPPIGVSFCIFSAYFCAPTLPQTYNIVTFQALGLVILLWPYDYWLPQVIPLYCNSPLGTIAAQPWCSSSPGPASMPCHMTLSYLIAYQRKKISLMKHSDSNCTKS